MKKLTKAVLLVLVVGGSMLGGALPVGAETPQGCIAARNMVTDGMYLAMSVDNVNGNLGMRTAVVNSYLDKTPPPPCQ